MAKRKQVQYREYYCMNCGAVQYIPRVKGQSVELWHVKDLYCYKCKKEQNHIEAPLERLEKHGEMYQYGNPIRRIDN